MCIALGREQHPLRRIEQGARCTWFVAQDSPKRVRKQWIAGLLKPAGTLYVDPGAAKALLGGKSLLPAGVTRVEGRFDRGDAVIVRDAAGEEIARGLCAYSSEDARRACGRRSQDLEAILGYRGRDEMIHRDDLALT
jgi:glutamate 5-kinase